MDLWQRIRAALFRAREDREMEEELRFHLEMETKKHEATGLPGAEARRQAYVKFGGLERVKEEVREARGTRVLERLGADLRYAARTLRRRPGFTAIAVLSLAIGIGANSAMFSVVNAVLLRGSSLERADELLNVYLRLRDFEFNPISYRDFEDLRDGTEQVFSGLSMSQLTMVPIARTGVVDTVLAEVVTGNYFSVRRLRPVVGRLLGPTDDVVPGGHPVVVLSHAYWRSAFGADHEVVGGELRLGGRTYTIVGVAPADYLGHVPGLAPALYAPIMMVNELLPSSEDRFEARLSYSLWGQARLAPGVTRTEAERATEVVAASLIAGRFDGWVDGRGFTLRPVSEVLFLPAIDPFLRIAASMLMVAAGLVLLLVCTNLASFLLARALDRRREVAVRLALGASRGALVRQQLTESAVLALLGGTAGLGLAVWWLGVVENAELPLSIPITLELSPDLSVMVFTLVVSAVAVVLLGLVPALQSTRPGLATTLKRSDALSGHSGQGRWRSALVVTQLTVSVVLLVAAGLFLRSWQEAQTVDPGFGREGAAVLSIMVPTTRFNPEEGRRYTRRLTDRLSELPGVDAVGIVDALPLTTTSRLTMQFQVDGHQPPPDEEGFRAERRVIDDGFFDAAGIPLVEGRGFDARDMADGQSVAIVSEATARRFWPGGDAVGRSVRAQGEDEGNLRVIGVAADVDLVSLGDVPDLAVYLPYSQVDARTLSVVVRTSGDPEAMSRAAVEAGRALDPDLWVVDATTLETHLSVWRLPAQLSALVLSTFGLVALLLSAIGLYGVVSYAVATRTREVGIRLALGADTAAVVRLLTANGGRLVLIGSGVGLVISFAVTRLLRGLLFGVGSLDAVTFIGAPVVLATTALLAAYLPARRAVRCDPVAALRSD